MGDQPWEPHGTAVQWVRPPHSHTALLHPVPVQPWVGFLWAGIEWKSNGPGTIPPVHPPFTKNSVGTGGSECRTRNPNPNL